MNLLVMAWRNVRRNSRRSIVTIGAMALALWTELIYAGLVAGMAADMTEAATEYDLGDIQVFSEDWTKRPSLHETIDHAALVPKLEAAGFAVTPRLQAGGLGAAGELSAGVALVGVDTARDPGVLGLSTAVAEGQWLDLDDPSGVVVGRGLARVLSLRPGSEVVVLSQGADGSMANDLLRVRGVLASVASDTDRGAILMTEGRFRELLVLPTGAHRLVLRAPPGVDLAAATAQVEGLAPGVDVQSWQELNPLLGQMLGSVKVQAFVVYFVLYVAVAILVLNAMFMALFERVREFGVLKAIGYGPGQVFSLMVVEGLLQAAVAAVVASALALPVMYWLTTEGVQVAGFSGVSTMGTTMPPVWHGAYTIDAVSVPLVLLFGTVFAAVVYPAAKAALIRPVDAMHHQ